jgi:hypothetical protein
MPTHTTTSRPATVEERKVILSQTKQGIALYGCLAVFCAIAAWAISSVGGCLMSLSSPHATNVGLWSRVGATAFVFLILFVLALISFVPFERRLHYRAAEDAAAQHVEELQVLRARVVEIALINDNEPILVFDIGEGRLLLLRGQWLRDETTYGAEPLVGDPYEEYINGLPAPNSFPSTDFTVVRLPHSGRVLQIRVSGAYLKPPDAIAALKPEYEFNDSEVFAGQLDEVADVLAAEHVRRMNHA